MGLKPLVSRRGGTSVSADSSDGFNRLAIVNKIFHIIRRYNVNVVARRISRVDLRSCNFQE